MTTTHYHFYRTMCKSLSFCCLTLLLLLLLSPGAVSNIHAAPPPPTIPGRPGGSATLDQFNATRGRNNINFDDKLRAQARKKPAPEVTYGKRPASASGKLHFSSYDLFGSGGGITQQKKP